MTSIIRMATEQDWPAILDLYNHYVRTTPFTFDLEDQTLANRAAWLASFGKNPRHHLMVACRNDVVSAFAASSAFRPKRAYDTSVEVSLYCRPDCTGQGIGKRLYTELMARLDAAATHRAYALITLPNLESEAIHQKFGFNLAGNLTEAGFKFDQYWSVAIWEKVFQKG